MHDLPDFVYFNHSIHVNKGVGCTTCHGQVDRMPLMWQEQSLQMEWCLDCHRNPERYVRPREAVFRVDYERAGEPARARPAAGRRISDSEAHELLDVSPMSTNDDRTARTRPSRRERSSGGASRNAGDPAFQERLYNEFPSQIEAITDPVARRTFLKLMGASLALAGVTACTRQPAEKIVPYVRQPEELIPGKPLFYATAMPLGGVATGLLVESHEGRPTKIEGNPLHPGSLGATDVFAQAAILGLYDPDRSQTLTNLGEIRPWSAFLGAISAALTAQKPLKGAGLRILTESVSSPTLAAQIRELLGALPGGEVASVGSGEPRQRARRRGARLRRVRRRAVPLRAGRRHPLARRRLPRLRAGRAALRARVRRAPASGERRAA